MATFQTLLETLDIPEYDGRKISLSTKDGKPVRIQTPRLYMPFGISGFTPAVGATKWNIDFSLKGYDEEDNYVKHFYETLQKAEAAIVEAVRAQSPKIFGKEMGVEELVPMFNSNIKPSTDREPKFRVRVDTTMDGELKPGIFDSEKNGIKTAVKDKLYARNSGVAIVEMNSVYFLNRKFGVTWKLHQLVVYEPQQLKGFQFIL
jgi:ribosomal protein S30